MLRLTGMGLMGMNGAVRAAVLVVVLLSACTEKVTSAREDIPFRSVDSVGSTLRADVPTCGGHPAATVVESASEVRLHVVSTVTHGGSQMACADAVTVTLKQPLGDRRVVDDVTQKEVSVTRR